MVTERAYWLAWSRIKDVGPVIIKRLWEHFGSLAAAWEAPASELLLIDGIGRDRTTFSAVNSPMPSINSSSLAGASQ
ncbi:MAG: hypothetical protein AAGL17_25110, partial [Cyanobacteria bacterium J06576_12]